MNCPDCGRFMRHDLHESNFPESRKYDCPDDDLCDGELITEEYQEKDFKIIDEQNKLQSRTDDK